jgi:tetratricopeptide (TPR) repeat protein
MKRLTYSIKSVSAIAMTAAFVLFVFLILNITSSQTIPSLYFAVINDDKDAIVDFLKSTESLSEFKEFMKLCKKEYGENIENDVYAQKIERQLMIKRLEQVLKNHSSSRDVLYGLHLLYEQEGDEKTALDYLERAREIDPNL